MKEPFPGGEGVQKLQILSDADFVPRDQERPHVAARLDYLKQCNAESSQWTRTEAMDILRQIAENPNKQDRDRINAVNLLNQMCGFTEPEKKIISQNTFFQFISPDGAIKGENQ